MKTSSITKLILSLIALTAFTATHAHAEEGVYTAASIGLNTSTDSKTQASNSNQPLKADWKIGPTFHFAFGYKFDALRTELEGAYFNNGLRKLEINNQQAEGASGQAKVFAIMTNLLYDIPIYKSLSSYLGGGIGLARVKLQSTQESLRQLQGTDSVIAYQFMTGFAYELNSQVALTLGYRLFSHGKTKHTIIAPSGQKVTRKAKAAQHHAVEVGIRYLF